MYSSKVNNITLYYLILQRIKDKAEVNTIKLYLILSFRESKTKQVNPTNTVRNGTTKSSTEKETVKTNKKCGKLNVYIPVLEYVTVDEFESVPK